MRTEVHTQVQVSKCFVADIAGWLTQHQLPNSFTLEIPTTENESQILAFSQAEAAHNLVANDRA